MKALNNPKIATIVYGGGAAAFGVGSCLDASFYGYVWAFFAVAWAAIAGSEATLWFIEREPTDRERAKWAKQATATPLYDLAAHLYRQREWSRRTFGPPRKGPARHITHIRKELCEIEESGGMDLVEWIDVVILAFDGAWRHGFTPEQIAEALHEKQIKNEGREWPDWRTVPENEAIEHVRGDDE